MNEFISIRVILDNLLDHPMLQDLTMERVVAYTIRFMQLVGSPKIFIEKVETLEVKEHRALLPCDFISINQVRSKKSHDMYISSTDTFHYAEDKTDRKTYKIQGTVIFTSNKEDEIEISYKAIPIDAEGYPMIVNNEAFIRALELYIKKIKFTILFDQGKLPNTIYSNIQQEYAWAVGQAQSSLIMPSIDEMRSFTNMINTLVPRTNLGDSAFKASNVREGLRYN